MPHTCTNSTDCFYYTCGKFTQKTQKYDVIKYENSDEKIILRYQI